MTKYKLCGDDQGESLVIAYEGEDPVTVPDTHPRFNDILDLLRTNSATDDAISEMVNTLQVVGKRLAALTDRISIAPYGVFFDGDPLRSELADILLELSSEGNTDRLMAVSKFLENAAANQSMEGIDAMYRWISNGDLVITSDGMILAYKGLMRNGKGEPVSISTGKALVDGVVHSGHIPNPVGAIVSMPRSEVTSNTSVACGPGLHAGTYDYASSFSQGLLNLVEINPRDVVSVPSDHSCKKMRVSKYVVKEAIEEKYSGSFYDNEDYDAEDDGDFTEEGEVDEQDVSLKDELENAFAVDSNENNPLTLKESDGNITVSIEVDGSINADNLKSEDDSTKSDKKRTRLVKWLTGE